MEKKIQWHAAFCSAMELELRADKAHLHYDREYNLGSKPLQIDLLVIEKDPEAEVENTIGKIFCGHNIMEYKSPKDHLGVDAYHKVLAYACLYKALGDCEDGIKAEDVTITLVRDSLPEKLFVWFAEHGYEVEAVYSGIYYICKGGFFATQVVVSSLLDRKEHCWLSRLTEKMTESEAKDFVLNMKNVSDKHELECADTVMDVVMHANKSLFEQVKEEPDMCEALAELMKPEFNAAMEKAMEEGMEKGMERGMEKGMEKGQVEAAEALFLQGMDLQTVQAVCRRLSYGELTELQKKLQNV